jgi:putative nucleotidyltransferase with HDIG domain
MRILFVDDEPNILSGLRRQLRDMRHKWDMAFTESGQQALALMATQPFDILVSDMRMPGMDGSQLLAEVRQRYPTTVRIILSGHADHELVMKTVRLAHQYLAKPCEAEVLQQVLRRADALHDLLSHDQLVGLVGQIDSLPALPSSYTHLLEELESPDSSLESIGALVSRDVGMSATVLKLVNSAFFGLNRHVASPTQAVGLLGLEVIRGLVLSQGFFNAFDLRRVSHLSFEAVWRHSLAVANLSRAIASLEETDPKVVDSAFIAGMLHDVGKLVLANVTPDAYGQVIATVRSQNRLVVDVERQVMGTSHAEAGAYLMGLWGVDEKIIHSIAYHHRPGAVQPRGGSSGRLCLAAVHVANVLEHELCIIHPEYVRPKLDRGFLAEYNLLDKLPLWVKTCQKLFNCEGADGTK